MRTSVRRALAATAIAGGFTVLGIAFSTTTASAAEAPRDTSGANGLLSGNQTAGDLTAPVKATGNQVTVIGENNQNAGSTDEGGSNGGQSNGSSDSGPSTTSGEGGTGSGNQTDAGATAPVEVSGNQVTVIGEGNDNASSGGSGDNGGSVDNGDRPRNTTSGEAGDGSGNQTDAQADVPVGASGNQVTVIGDDNVADVQPGENGQQDQAGQAGSGGASSTSGEDGTGSGNQTGLGAVVPVDVSGNQITVIGDGNQSETTAAEGTGSEGTGTAGNQTDGTDGTGSGNQTDAGALVPVDVSGNQITVIGDGNTAENTSTEGNGGESAGASSTDGTDGTGSGNQTGLGAVVPVDVSGKQITVIGDGNQSETTSTQGGTGTGEDAADGTAAGNETDGTDGTGSGNQTDAGLGVPVDASGNQITVIGDGNTAENTTTEGTDAASPGDGEGNTTSGADGTGSGNQTDAAAEVPVDAGDNQVVVIGDGNSTENTTTEGGATGTTGGDTTSGEDGTGSGNQTQPAVTAPVDAGDNQVIVIGDGNTATSTEEEAPAGETGGDTTDGTDGTGSGNQTAPGIVAPIDVSDNQVIVIGDGNGTDRETAPGQEDDGTDPGQNEDPGDTGDGTDGSDGEQGNGAGTSDDGSGNGGFGDSTQVQGGPAATMSGVLPQTGAAADLLTWGIAGLALLMLGLGLVVGTRRCTTRPEVREVALAG